MIEKTFYYDIIDKFGIHLEVVKPKEGITKMASEISDESKAYIKTLSSIDNNAVYVLVNAVGASEYYGPNLNLDYSPEPELVGNSDEYGYMTFQQAHVFADHQNRDPKYKVGDILKTFWNPRMHRIELLLIVYKSRAPEIVSRIDQSGTTGEIIGLSYGLTCIFGGNKVLKGDMSYENIETLKIGDEVRTHLNHSCKISNVMSKEISKKVYLKAVGVPQVTCTIDHPFLIVKKENIDKSFGTKIYRKLVKEYNYEWTEAQDLRLGDYLVTPIDHTVKESCATRAYARLLGYYLAEGSLIYGQTGNSRIKGSRKINKNKILGIRLGFHKDETYFRDEVISLCEEFGTKNKPTLIKHGADNCIEVSIYDSVLASWCLADAGKDSHYKKLSEAMFYLPKELQKELLGAYINGDGYQDPKNGRITIQTASEVLAYQLVHLGYRLGILFSICEVNWEKNGKITKGYMLQCGANSANILVDYSNKLNPIKVKSQNGQGRFITESKNFVLTKITNLDIVDEKDTVYNLTVDQDESFIVNTLAVHNCPSECCSVCGNTNSTRATRCTHLKYELGKVYPDGTKTMAITRKPKFYDISFVWKRANPEAVMMTKLASIDGETKKAIIEKNFTTEPSILGMYRGLADKIISRIIQIEPNLSAAEMAELANKPLKETLATMTAMGIILNPEEFKELMKKKASEVQDILKFSWQDFNPEIVELLLPKMAERSFYRPYIFNRVLENRDFLKHASLTKKAYPISRTRLYQVLRDRLLPYLLSPEAKGDFLALVAMGFGLHYGKRMINEVPEPGQYPFFLDKSTIQPYSMQQIHDAALAGIVLPSQPVRISPAFRKMASGIPAAYLMSAYRDLDISNADIQTLYKDASEAYDSSEEANMDLRIIDLLY